MWFLSEDSAVTSIYLVQALWPQPYSCTHAFDLKIESSWLKGQHMPTSRQPYGLITHLL